MTQVTLLVRCVECLESLTGECRVQERQCTISLRPLIGRVPLIHERTNHARERFGWCVCVGLRFREDFSKGFSDPVVSGRAIVPIIGAAVLKKLCQEAATSITEQALLVLEIAADHVCDLRERAILEFHSAYPHP